MNILITGGAGFIGSNYVYYHLETRPQDQLTVLDALTYSGHREYLAEAESKGLRFIHGRIEDRDLVQDLFKTSAFDAVIHFAAETHVDRSIKDPGLFVTTNVQGTQTLLDAARDFKVKRFHHISTDEVYGDLGFGSTEQFTEDSFLQPSSPYSASKAGSDHLCLAYLRTYGVPVSISRCSNNYGPYQSLENFIPLMIQKALADEPLPLYGNGKNVRDWLYVRDHCKAILRILEAGKVGEIYNVGGNCEQENLEIARMILRLLKKPEQLIQFVPDRPGHDARYAINYSKIEQELGWSPSVSLEEGVQETLAWYTLNTYERNYTRWRDRVQTLSPHQSYQQTPTPHL